MSHVFRRIILACVFAVASEAAESDAQGADPTLCFRPELRARADREVPAGRSSNIPALVQTSERLKPLAAAHKGRTQSGSPPSGEPANIFAPSDRELLLSLAGDRIWRSLQVAPPGTMAKAREKNPGGPVVFFVFFAVMLRPLSATIDGDRLTVRSPGCGRTVAKRDGASVKTIGLCVEIRFRTAADGTTHSPQVRLDSLQPATPPKTLAS